MGRNAISVQTYYFKLMELMMVNALVGGSNYSFMNRGWLNCLLYQKRGGQLELLLHLLVSNYNQQPNINFAKIYLVALTETAL